MNSTIVKMLLALTLVINLWACNNSNTTSNSTTPTNTSEANNSSNANTAGSNSTAPQNSSDTSRHPSKLPTLEEVQKELQERKLGKGQNTPAPKQITSQNPPPVEISQDRELVRYYLYLVTRLGLPFNQPIEMPGGASLFSAGDIIQFTMAEPKVAVVAAKFTDADKQVKGTEVLNKLNVEGRTVVTEGNYVIMVKGADDNLLKILSKALKDFPKQP